MHSYSGIKYGHIWTNQLPKCQENYFCNFYKMSGNVWKILTGLKEYLKPFFFPGKSAWNKKWMTEYTAYKGHSPGRKRKQKKQKKSILICQEAYMSKLKIWYNAKRLHSLKLTNKVINYQMSKLKIWNFFKQRRGRK